MDNVRDDQKMDLVDELESDLQMTVLMGQVHMLVFYSMERKLRQSPISAQGLWFLDTVLMLGDHATPGEVAKLMVRRHNTATTMLDRLVKKGFLKREKVKGQGIRPQVRISLTEIGRQVYEDTKRMSSVAVIPAILSCFSPEEKQEFRRLLFKLRKKAVEEARVYEEPQFPLSEG